MSLVIRKARPKLIVDGRMLFSSGIGRYLREILLRVPESVPFSIEVVCNTTSQRDWIERSVPSAVPLLSQAKIYSLREQLLALKMPFGATYWVPHYNVPRLCSCRLVATIHDVAPLALPEVFSGLKRQWAARFYFNNVKRRSSHIIAVSHFTSSELQSRGLAQSGSISVIENGVGNFWFQGPVAEGRRDVLLFVGNLKPHKNLGRLIDAVEIVRQTHPVELEVAGKIGGFSTGLDDRVIKRLRSTPWIRTLGEASDEELRGRYQQARAFIFPSLYEGFGLPMLEAMAAGCPVVASRAGALVEVAGRGREQGGVVDYFDPLDVHDMASAITRNLAMSGSEKERIQAGGRSIASSYTWERAAKATWSLLVEKSAA
jgi:glycosyltransferase involved in cell wall biosynthesis